ncbi:sensor histidine kinase [Sphingomonas jatrophae]|uniref:histidine kinase n=1 Tax=Sphingomonas jatrophae TaxID=1166337 RepID=A0A1I6L1S9_9SPHN|nr:ATP-binding protein [Sphingomonas jatrophae]SFR97463.1 PAS domain-containing protein [Sphingomonas jatrophae]
MVFDRSFLAGLVLRVVAVGLAAAALVWSVATPGLAATRLLAAAALVAAMAWLWSHVGRTNREVARFVEAIGHGDLSQGFSARGGSGFDALGGALDGAMRRLRAERAALTAESGFARAVLEEVPTALLLVDGDGVVELANKAARRLFARVGGVRIDDFAAADTGLGEALRLPARAAPRVIDVIIAGLPRRSLVRVAEAVRQGRVTKVVTVEPIQSEIDAATLAAQSDLVRVLTHEIMNSMTPVTSLAQTAAGLMAEVAEDGDPLLDEARLAVETLARRAQGIMYFVDSYREISRVPEPRLRSFEVQPWAEEIVRVAATNSAVPIRLESAQPRLMLSADPDLLAQVIINLVKNGGEAAQGSAAAPQVTITVEAAGGGRIRIQVEDNGPGVPEALRGDVFLPFFTTKPAGTGVGLSLARQVVVAHGGTLTLASGASGGARFDVVI